MELSHSFTVPAPIEAAWQTFMDLHTVGGCFPGATVTEVTEEGFTGTVKVKLGPIALLYAGSGSFVERDDAARRAVIDARGKDKRGNGTAGATVSISLTSESDSSTRADVATDLHVTGKPAQFGRGVMQDVSDKLLQQFLDCVEGQFATGAGEPTPAAAAGEPAPVAAAGEPGGELVEPAAVAGATGPAPGLVPPAEPAAAASPASAPGAAAPGSPAPPPRHATRPAGSPDAINLGSTVLPVLVKTYGKQVLGILLVVVAAIVVYRWLR